jgi:hypothetical protein
MNRVGIGLSYRPARLHKPAELIPWNRFLGSLKVKKFGLWRAGTIALFPFGSQPPIDFLKFQHWNPVKKVRSTVQYILVHGLDSLYCRIPGGKQEVETQQELRKVGGGGSILLMGRIPYTADICFFIC